MKNSKFIVGTLFMGLAISASAGIIAGATPAVKETTAKPAKPLNAQAAAAVNVKSDGVKTVNAKVINSKTAPKANVVSEKIVSDEQQVKNSIGN